MSSQRKAPRHTSAEVPSSIVVTDVGRAGIRTSQDAEAEGWPSPCGQTGAKSPPHKCHRDIHLTERSTPGAARSEESVSASKRLGDSSLLASVESGPAGSPPVSRPSSVVGVRTCSSPLLVEVPGEPGQFWKTYPLPLPGDVDLGFKVDVKVKGGIGLRLVECQNVHAAYNYPNQAIMTCVDNANMSMDTLIPQNPLVVQRGLLSQSEKLHPQTVKPIVKEPGDGFTVAHLLTLIVRRQYKAYTQMAAGRRKSESTGVGAAPPAYESLYIVAIRRSDGKGGRVRWFPELEVRELD